MRGADRGIVIQERDLHLLEELVVMRVVDREQAKIVGGFRSTTRVNARLLALTRAGLLRRFFLGAAATGRKALYALSARGAALIGVTPRGPRRPKDGVLVADFFVSHQLTVNRVYCLLKYGALPASVSFRSWLSFTEPLRKDLGLIPDGYFELGTPEGTMGAFLEIDLGHESLPIWKEKTKKYVQFAVSGEFARSFEPDQFRVLVVANSERRLHSIRKVVRLSTQKIFWFATLESFDSERFFAPTWVRPEGEDRLPLIPPIQQP